MGGYSPIGFVRCGRAACRVSKIVWKIGKETGGKKMEEPHSLKSNEMAEVNFVPQEDRQGDRRQEDGGAALPEVERDGGGELRPAAAARRGHVQELRGPVSHRVPGWQRRGHAWQDREEDGQDGGRQGQEVNDGYVSGLRWRFLSRDRIRVRGVGRTVVLR